MFDTLQKTEKFDINNNITSKYAITVSPADELTLTRLLGSRTLSHI